MSKPRGNDLDATGRPEASLLELDWVLSNRLVRTVFQPIVELRTGEVLGYEALSRGPADGRLQSPDALFAAALRYGRTRALDELCRVSALTAALAGGLREPLLLFVNVEPAALDLRRLAEPVGVLAQAQQQLRVVVEVTERDLTARPAELLAVVARIRELGGAVALDDVGADPRSLALMPLLAPEIIKLDLALVQQQPGLAAAEIIAAVAAEAERSGSLVLAEGIETDQHAELALGMGATLGQGWRYGRPGALPAPPAMPAAPLQLPARPTPPAGDGSVFQLAAGSGTVQRAGKPLLVAISQHLERQALALGDHAVVLAAFQHARYFTPDTQRRYQQLARSASFVGALGADLGTQPAPGVRGAHLHPDDPVIGEWDIAVLGPHFAAALVAHDLGDTRSENARRFDYVLTYQRNRVTAITGALMARMAGRTQPAGHTTPPTQRTRPTASLPAPTTPR